MQTRLYRVWNADVSVYDHARRVEFFKRNQEWHVRLMLGGGQRFHHIVVARPTDHQVIFLLDESDRKTEVKRGAVVERGWISIEYQLPSKDDDAHDRNCWPDIDAVNARRPRIEYVIRRGPFCLEGAYTPWQTQVYGLRLEWQYSPYLDEIFHFATDDTQWTDRPELALPQTALEFYSEETSLGRLERERKQQDQRIHRYVYRHQKQELTNAIVQALARSPCFPRVLILILVDYAWDVVTVLDSSQALNQMNRAGRTLERQRLSNPEDTQDDAEDEDHTYTKRMVRINARYGKLAWQDGFLSFEL